MSSLALNPQINRHNEAAVAAKVKQAAIKARIEQQRVHTEEWNLSTEKHKTTTAMWRSQAAAIQSQRAHVGYQSELVGLATDRVNLDTARVGLGAAQDKFAVAQANRYLDQQADRASLTIKAVQVSALREQARHAQVLDGAPAPYFLPSVQGGSYGLPAVAGLNDRPLQRRVG